ncbi:MAG: N-acetylmuramoyl-L-alanine amidase [Clostridia bacterium]|nr:N-acetylmuramoyl-L-alanine amidase [Clostridia bacterium]MBQ9958521.1 N-acetylmuramoyl-L-alanine amidase [Clostridia bacterium]
MPKVYISPSVQQYNLCEYGDTEKDHCQEYADILERYFDACGIEYKRNRNKSFQEAVAESNAWNPDIHYACHTNAFDGKTRYSVLLVYNAVMSSPAYQCAEDIKEFREQVYPNPIYVNQNRSLYEIRYSTSPCVYDEIVFHDNIDDATLFHVRMQTFAELTARGFCKYFGIPFVYPQGVGLEPGVSDTGMLQSGMGADDEVDATCEQLQDLFEDSQEELNEMREKYNMLRRDINRILDKYN